MNTLVFMWWFAVVSPSGELVLLEYRDKPACEVIQRAYERVTRLKTTTCQQKT